jgi:hypothetical protein
VEIYFYTGRIYFAFGDDSGYIFWMTRGVWGPSFKRKKLVIFFHYWGYLWQCIDAVLGYRRPATCNTELRVLLIAVYNVAHYF